MSKKLFELISIIFIVLLHTTISVESSMPINIFHNKSTIRIAAVHSYNYQHPCGRPQMIGFVQELVKKRPDIHWHIENYYMQTKTVNVTLPKIQEQALYALKFVTDEVIPDFVYVTDDNAFKYVGSVLTASYKVFFSGLNNPFNMYRPLIQNINNVAGVMENVKIKKFLEIIRNSNTIIDKIYILTDKDLTTTGKGMYTFFCNQLNQYHFSYIHVTFINKQQLINWLKVKNGEKSLFIIVLQELYDNDIRKYINKLEICKLIVKYNKTNLEYTLNPQYVRLANISIAEGPDFYDMGRLAADLLLQTIKTGIMSHTIVYPKAKLVCSYKRLQQLGYEDIYEMYSNKFDKVY